jgi:FtsZ-interacting cell division protein ZipA
VKIALILVAVLLGGWAVAQERSSEKKKADKKAQKTHKQATPEQIRKFNDLEKKQQK